jgi:hypothetical protein
MTKEFTGFIDNNNRKVLEGDVYQVEKLKWLVKYYPEFKEYWLINDASGNELSRGFNNINHFAK